MARVITINSKTQTAHPKDARVTAGDSITFQQATLHYLIRLLTFQAPTIEILFKPDSPFANNQKKIVLGWRTTLQVKKSNYHSKPYSYHIGNQTEGNPCVIIDPPPDPAR